MSIVAGLFSFLPIGHTKSNVNGKLLIIGGAEDRQNERVILKKFIELSEIKPSLSSFLQLAVSLHLYGPATQTYLKILAQQM